MTNKNNVFKKKKMIISIFIILIILIISIITICIFALKDDSEASIKLETHVNEIYEWQYEIGDKKIVKFVEKERYGDLDDKHGGNITEKYTFKALKQGETTIKFTFVNTNNKSYGEIKKYEVKVDKKNNLSITEVANN